MGKYVNSIAKGIIKSDLLVRKILKLKKPSSPYYIKKGIVKKR